MTAQVWQPPRAWRGRKDAGMPPMRANPRPISHFEFWPVALFYGPMIPYWVWLSLRHGGIGACAAANPSFPNGGVAGEEKSRVFRLFHGAARDALAPWIAARAMPGCPAREQAAALLSRWSARGGALPAVAKPEIGCRGKGVRLIEDEAQMADYIAGYPPGEGFVLQEFVDKEGEAGVFYIRYPGEQKGRIFALTLKYFPYVTGDGQRSLRALIEDDPRAGAIADIYLPRHAAHLDAIPAAGVHVRLSFAGSHSGGTIFRDGTAFATEAMREAFDRIADGIEGFHFGRYDVRFDDFEALRRGEGFTILELNGGSGEATSIWDSATPLWRAYRTLAEQYRHLWAIGGINRRRGAKSAGFFELWRAYRREKALFARYPLMQ